MSFSTPSTTPSLPRMAMAVLHKVEVVSDDPLPNQRGAHAYATKRTCCSPPPSWHTQFEKLGHLVRTERPRGRTGGRKYNGSDRGIRFWSIQYHLQRFEQSYTRRSLPQFQWSSYSRRERKQPLWISKNWQKTLVYNC